MAEVTLTKQNFQEEVINSDKPVLVDFWASWCGPCKMLAPIVAEIAAENTTTLKVGKVNVDDEEELAAQFQIASIPTLMLFKDGKVVNTSVGYRPKAQLEAMLEL